MADIDVMRQVQLLQAKKQALHENMMASAAKTRELSCFLIERQAYLERLLAQKNDDLGKLSTTECSALLSRDLRDAVQTQLEGKKKALEAKEADLQKLEATLESRRHDFIAGVSEMETLHNARLEEYHAEEAQARKEEAAFPDKKRALLDHIGAQRGEAEIAYQQQGQLAASITDAARENQGLRDKIQHAQECLASSSLDDLKATLERLEEEARQCLEELQQAEACNMSYAMQIPRFQAEEIMMKKEMRQQGMLEP
eukprot:jgi/Mesvir1/16466/Mv10028-RA.1